MKNLFKALFMFAFVTVLFTSCSVDEISSNEDNTEVATGQGDSINSSSGTETDEEDEDDNGL